eukprot:gene47397-63536_t
MATLKGVGRGKTRMIEEARIRMGLLYPTWLPIAITFNHKTYNDGYSVYNIPIIDAQTRLGAALNLSESTNYARNMLRIAENLIAGTVRHIAGSVQKLNPSIDSMVLFIDEPVKLVEDKRFPEDVYGDGY